MVVRDGGPSARHRCFVYIVLYLRYNVDLVIITPPPLQSNPPK